MIIVLRLLETAKERAQIFGMPMPDKEIQVALEQIPRELGLSNGTVKRLLE